jgi:hypothetical protein
VRYGRGSDQKHALYHSPRLDNQTRLSRLELTSNAFDQRFLLAEAIKTSSIPVEKLLSFIDDGNVQPAWTQMLLPLGEYYPQAPGFPRQAAGAAHTSEIA